MSNSHDDAIVYTLSHEFVHFAKKWSHKEYKVFTDFMVEQFAEHGKSLDELVRQKMGEIGTNDYDYAFEEVVADACERMLLDSNAMEKLALLKKKSPNVFEKFMQHIKELLNKLKLLHADTHTTNDYSAALNEMEDVLGKLYELFENMAVDAVRNFEASSKSKNNDSINKRSKKMEQNIYDDPLYPKSTRESAAFNRSMANKTSDLKKGRKEVIFIYTADNVFVVDADGYMNGKIRSVIKIDGNEDRLRTLREEYRDVVDRERESIDEGIDSVRDGYRRYMRSISALRNGAKHSDDAGVDDGQRRSRARGDKEGGSPNSKEIKHQNKRVVEPITSKDVQILREIGKKSINQFTAEDIQKSQKWAHKFFQELGVKSPFFRAWFGDWRQFENKIEVPILEVVRKDGKNPRGVFQNKDTGWAINSSSVGYDETISHSGKDKLSLMVMRNIDAVIENAVLFDTEVSEYGRGKKSFYTAFMHKLYAIIRINKKPYIAKLAVEESYSPGQNSIKKFYHVRAIKIEPTSAVGIDQGHTPIIADDDSTISISNLFSFVKKFDDVFNPVEVSRFLTQPENGYPCAFFYDAAQQKDGFYHLTTDKSGEMVYATAKKPFIVEGEDVSFEEIIPLARKKGYDAVIFQLNGIANEVYVFSQNQVKSADNAGTFDRNDTDMKRQKKKTSNRAILADMLESTIDTSTQEGQNELAMLQKYQADIGKIEEFHEVWVDYLGTYGKSFFNKIKSKRQLNRLLFLL